MTIARKAVEFIVEKEVSSKGAYIKRYQRPIRPGGASGITIGIGYDIGAGVSSKEQLWSDWKGKIPDEMIRTLEPAIGVTGSRAQDLVEKMQSVVVPWDAALDVFENHDIPKWEAICRKHLPNFDELSPLCKGVLVSLAYNRGPSFSKAGERYGEMRAIRRYMVERKFSKIPFQIRSMKRLWTTPSVRGVAIRREEEAQLFEQGLKDIQPKEKIS